MLLVKKISAYETTCVISPNFLKYKYTDHVSAGASLSEL